MLFHTLSPFINLGRYYIIKGCAIDLRFYRTKTDSCSRPIIARFYNAVGAAIGRSPYHMTWMVPPCHTGTWEGFFSLIIAHTRLTFPRKPRRFGQLPILFSSTIIAWLASNVTSRKISFDVLWIVTPVVDQQISRSRSWRGPDMTHFSIIGFHCRNRVIFAIWALRSKGVAVRASKQTLPNCHDDG